MLPHLKYRICLQSPLKVVGNVYPVLITLVADSRAKLCTEERCASLEFRMYLNFLLTASLLALFLQMLEHRRLYPQSSSLSVYTFWLGDVMQSRIFLYNLLSSLTSPPSSKCIIGSRHLISLHHDIDQDLSPSLGLSPSAQLFEPQTQESFLVSCFSSQSSSNPLASASDFIPKGIPNPLLNIFIAKVQPVMLPPLNILLPHLPLYRLSSLKQPQGSYQNVSKSIIPLMKAYLQWLPMTYGIQSKAQRDLVLFLPALGSHSVLYVIRETVRLSIL